MKPRVKEAILWGVVGLLTFLVLLQGYEIVQGVGVDLTVKIVAAIVVAVATTAVTYVTSRRVQNGEEPDDAVTDERDREENS